MLKVFIINLKEATSRRSLMQEEIFKLKSLNDPFLDSIEFIFFDALSYKDDSYLRYKEHFSSIRSKLRRAMDTTKGELACYSSHFSLWQECIRLNEGIVILEDDITFLPNFLQGLQEIIKSPFRYVRLFYIDKKKFFHIKDSFYYTLQDVAGAQGYYITPSAAIAFSKPKYWDLPVDLLMDYVARNKVDNILYLPPLLQDASLNTEGFSTSIPNRYNQKKPFLWKLVRELYRPFISFRKLLFSLTYKKPRF